jgi:hypothetical protein
VNDDPVRFSVDYPDRDLNRLTTALRIFTVIPIAIVLASIGGHSADTHWTPDRTRPRSSSGAPDCCSRRRC